MYVSIPLRPSLTRSSRSPLLFALGIAMMTLIAANSMAGTIHVPGDHALVREALAVAAPGDTVLLAGPHHGSAVEEPFVVRPGITVLGDGNAEDITWSVAWGLEFPLNRCGANPPAVVENISLGLYTCVYEELVKMFYPGATIRNCIIYDDCAFRTAIVIHDGGTIEGCTINAGLYTSVHVVGGDVAIKDNVFGGCSSAGAPDFALRIDLESADVVVRGNSFLTYGQVDIWRYPGASGSATFVNNMFGLGTVYPGYIQCSGDVSSPIDLDVRYNLFASEEFGLTNCPASLGEGNLVGVDPLICDPYCDHRLQPDSPAIGAGEGGVTIGAQEIGCEDVLPVGTTAPAVAEAPHAWPNPGRGPFHVKYAHLPTDATPDAVVYDVTGRVVARLTVENGEAVWSPDADVPAGVYFVQLHETVAGTVRSVRLQRIE